MYRERGGLCLDTRGCRLRRSEVSSCAACLSASGQHHITQRHVEVQLHSFMTSAPGGGQRSAAHTGCLTPVDRSFGLPPNKIGGPQRRSGCLESSAPSETRTTIVKSTALSVIRCIGSQMCWKTSRTHARTHVVRM
jgi:hypothetical protein